jgi:hypothetical protein
VSQFINANYEPVWVTVRPVPIVRIDFGDGRVLTRTLHGNILSAVCSADGTLLDALPGIYTPEAYIDRLNQLRLLAGQYQQRVSQRLPVTDFLTAYHTKAAEAIKASQEPQRFNQQLQLMPIGKGRIETPMEKLIAGQQQQLYGQFPVQQQFNTQQQPNVRPPAPPPVAGWAELTEDTQLNEGTRRRQIHELLARTGPVRPDKVLKPIYRDVLHADLDDPYLGLGKTLFEENPGVEEKK